jgi:hypothetical protein
MLTSVKIIFFQACASAVIVLTVYSDTILSSSRKFIDKSFRPTSEVDQNENTAKVFHSVDEFLSAVGRNSSTFYLPKESNLSTLVTAKENSSNLTEVILSKENSSTVIKVVSSNVIEVVLSKGVRIEQDFVSFYTPDSTKEFVVRLEPNQVTGLQMFVITSICNLHLFLICNF